MRQQSSAKSKCVPWLLLISLMWCVACAQAVDTPIARVIINRKGRLLEVLGSEGKPVIKSQVGIGKGGLKRKRGMSDCVTPLGNFTVDIILSEDPANCRVSSAVQSRYKRTNFSRYFSSQQGLAELFETMNSIDFDGDGKPDRAYGSLYIGLDSNSTVTGPKMRFFRSTPYWFSIAVHGVSNSSLLGKAESGGCVQADDHTLRYLAKVLAPGSLVTIIDR